MVLIGQLIMVMVHQMILMFVKKMVKYLVLIQTKFLIKQEKEEHLNLEVLVLEIIFLKFKKLQKYMMKKLQIEWELKKEQLQF